MDSVIWPCRSWECVVKGSPGGRKRKPGLAVTHGPLTSLWNASSLASEKQRILVGLHLSKCCLAVGLEQQLSRERNSCREGEVRHLIQVSLSPPVTSQGRDDLWLHGTDSLTNIRSLTAPWLAGSGGQEFGKKGSHSKFLFPTTSRKIHQTLKVTPFGSVSGH